MKLPSNPQKMLQQAKEMQDRLKLEISAIRVEASTGGGMVTVRMDGNKTVIGIQIDPEALEDVEMLQDMIRGACNEAARRVEEMTQQKISGMMGGMLGGMSLPPGLLG